MRRVSGDHGLWRRRGRCYIAGHPHTPTCHGGSRSPMLEKNSECQKDIRLATKDILASLLHILHIGQCELKKIKPETESKTRVNYKFEITFCLIFFN